MEKPIPTETWIAESFRYYDHHCALVNAGGHKDSEALRNKYRNSSFAIANYFHVYMGTWKVYCDDVLVLMTGSYSEAENKYKEIKQKCIDLHKPAEHIEDQDFRNPWRNLCSIL